MQFTTFGSPGKTIGHDGAALFTPSADDERYRAAGSLRGVWSFTRASRLVSLKDRVQRQADGLIRLRAEAGAAGDLAAVDRLDARIAVLGARFRSLSRQARAERRAERALESRLAAEAAGSYAMPLDVARALSRYSVVGHD